MTWLIAIGVAILCLGIAMLATKKLGTGLRIFGLVLLFLGMILAVGAWISIVPDDQSKPVETTEETVDTSVSFDEIYQAYKDNELAADDLYQGNRYRIEAEINGMTNDGLANLTGGATLTMQRQVGDTIVFFYAEFEADQEEALKSVSVGDTIVFDGTCESAGMWEDCQLVTE